MADRRTGLDFKHCRLVLQELARFHALSFAMKVKAPEKFSRVLESLTETIYMSHNKPLFSPALENAFKIALFSLRVMSRDDPALLTAITKLEAINTHLFERMTSFVTPREPLAVVNHGDCWINNLLFKYTAAEDVVDLRLLDLQVTRYASPVIDVLHLLYTSTQDAVRRRHFDDLLVGYHDALVARLRDEDVEEVMTLEELKEEVRKKALYGLINGLWLLPVVTADSATLPNLEEFAKDDLYSDENVEYWIKHQTQDYRDKIRNLVLEYIVRGYL